MDIYSNRIQIGDCDFLGSTRTDFATGYCCVICIPWKQSSKLSVLLTKCMNLISACHRKPLHIPLNDGPCANLPALKTRKKINKKKMRQKMG